MISGMYSERYFTKEKVLEIFLRYLFESQVLCFLERSHDYMHGNTLPANVISEMYSERFFTQENLLYHFLSIGLISNIFLER